MEEMSQDKKFLGMLGSETVHKFTSKCDGVVGMSNPNMDSNIKDIMKVLKTRLFATRGLPTSFWCTLAFMEKIPRNLES